MDEFDFHGFDWDDGNWPKCGKHGVSKEEIEALLRGELFGIFPTHSATTELRRMAIGLMANGRWIVVVFTDRVKDGRHVVRPFSARYMHAKEVARYVRLRQSEG